MAFYSFSELKLNQHTYFKDFKQIAINMRRLSPVFPAGGHPSKVVG